MTNRGGPLLSVGKKTLLAGAGMLAVILPIAVGVAQSPDMSWETRAGGKKTPKRSFSNC